ncbi:hypothetical protein GGI15_001720 [Coemansia interrupta]|uniref:Uncharacterized protein n=1 Tax=Coemansia interrupta TaxID=1126814 RepID=A0A9W8HH31_9FUNG|nr:hypothetical protein GGI15_001720 [Coemansia interrupta]
MASPSSPALPDLSELLAAATTAQQSKWAFVVSDEWVVTVQTLSSVSLICSLLVISLILHIFLRHRKYLARLSLRISFYVALSDMLTSIVQILQQHNDLMVRQSPAGLRFILWLSLASTLFSVLLTLCIALQLHLSTLTRVRVLVYMRMERYYVLASLLVACALPAVAVAMMRGIYWVPSMHAFNWPTGHAWERKLVLWLCCYLWIILTIVYCALVALLLGLRIWAMWRDSVEVVTPRMPEKWDWQKLTDTQRLSDDTMYTHGSMDMPQTPMSTASRLSLGPNNPQPGGARGYLVTLTQTDRQGGPVAVRSYVDKRRFLRSIQRLALYPLVPVLTLLGMVVMNMVDEPTKPMYVYATVMAATGGIMNLVVFMLNPALPDIWREAALSKL